MDTIRVDTRDGVTRIRLNRPDVRNALNDVLVAELHGAFTGLDPSTRVVVLSGEGKVFCAGADAEWMKKSKSFTAEENRRDAAAVASMLRAVDECPLPVISRIHGAALGGGAGLAAASDIALAEEGTQFGFPEVRLGIVPALISTYVLPRIGARAARRYFLTGERFGAAEAAALGLVHEVVPPGALDQKVDALCGEILQGGPKAQGIAKRLIRGLADLPRDEAIRETIRTLSEIRVTPEAQEGLGAFLEKRKPRWPS
jgi:methylglutaconyl-CoA hydratase